MGLFKCHKCGHESLKVGSCPECKVALEKECPFCKEEYEFCTCQSARIQSKGGKKGKAETGVKTH